MSCSNGQGDTGLEDTLSLLIMWAKVSRRREEVIWFFPLRTVTLKWLYEGNETQGIP